LSSLGDERLDIKQFLKAGLKYESLKLKNENEKFDIKMIFKSKVERRKFEIKSKMKSLI
jgi:hypothetical protein